MKPFGDLMLGGPTLAKGDRRQCWLCNRFLSKGPIPGAFQCKFCDWIYLTDKVNPMDIKRYNENLCSPKRRILDFVQHRKATTTKTIHEHFPDVPVLRIVNQLRREGKVAIQQSGYLGDSLHHEKLVVPVTVKGAGSASNCAQLRRPVL